MKRNKKLQKEKGNENRSYKMENTKNHRKWNEMNIKIIRNAKNSDNGKKKIKQNGNIMIIMRRGKYTKRKELDKLKN